MGGLTPARLDGSAHHMISTSATAAGLGAYSHAACLNFNWVWTQELRSTCATERCRTRPSQRRWRSWARPRMHSDTCSLLPAGLWLAALTASRQPIAPPLSASAFLPVHRSDRVLIRPGAHGRHSHTSAGSPARERVERQLKGRDSQNASNGRKSHPDTICSKPPSPLAARQTASAIASGVTAPIVHGMCGRPRALRLRQ